MADDCLVCHLSKGLPNKYDKFKIQMFFLDLIKILQRQSIFANISRYIFPLEIIIRFLSLALIFYLFSLLQKSTDYSHLKTATRMIFVKHIN
jgi:hypothetical protein